MDLLKCRVCDSQGSYTQLGKSIPKINDNYTFYAAVNANVPAGGQPELPLEVKVTMPVGGKMGLFRFPRIGEWVLIGQVGQTGYEDVDINGEKHATHVTAPTGEWVLLSYFPQAEEGDDDKNTPFYPKRAKKTVDNNKTGFFADQLNPATMKEFLDDNGMAIRYLAEDNQNKPAEAATGSADKIQHTVNDGAWSEIGFYNKKAKWPDSLKKFDETKAGNSLERSRFSRQDMINIKSTGDIESRADNYHLIKAKRFELLANTEELSPEIRAHNDRNAWFEWEPEYAPLGDHPTDDPAIHNGDVHIRAGKRVVIKADSEIRLQVGRTVLVINDSGFSVTARKVNSNVDISQDTSLSLKARGGIDMFGENVNIASSRKFSIADAWGGSLGSMLGILNISGIQINQKIYERLQQQFTEIVNTFGWTGDLIANTAVNSNGWETRKIIYGFNIFKTIVNDVKSFYGLHSGWGDRRVNSVLGQGDAPGTGQESGQGDAPVTGQESGQGDAPVTAQESGQGDAPRTGQESGQEAEVGLEPIEVAIAMMNMILDITSAAYYVVEKTLAAVWRTDLRKSLKENEKTHTDAGEESEKTYTGAWKKKLLSELNMAAMDYDNGIIALGFDFFGYFFSKGSGGHASIKLRNSGDIIMKANSLKSLYGHEATQAAVPVNTSLETIQSRVRIAAYITKLASDVSKIIFQGMDMGLKIPSYVEKL
jgi:hypothetical protein